jgi:very-short-patch-repair endonuclease
MPRLLRPATFRARALRRASTPAEQALWTLLRGRRLDGAKFRRQQPLGPYFADFFCEQARLVVEADGAHHFPAPPSDVARDAYFQACGLTVLRLPNHDILAHPEHVLARIRALLPAPLSLRERGGG